MTNRVESIEELAKAGDMFGGEDDDNLWFWCPLEYLDDVAENGDQFEELVGLEIYAYKRKGFGVDEVKRLAENAADYIDERFSDEFGQYDDGLALVVVAELARAIAPALYRHLRPHVRQCEAVAVYTLTEEGLSDWLTITSTLRDGESQ